MPNEAHASSNHGHHVLLTGGGSGGHVFPALAIAAALADRRWTVSYAGSATGMEARLVAERGLPFYPVAAQPLVGRGRMRQAGALWTLLRSGVAARALIRRLGADVVVGTGGYVAAPAVVGARLARRPSLLVEPNANTGVANRMLGRLASAAAIAYPATANQFRCPCTVTGIPVRAAFFDAGPLPAMPPSAPWRLLVLGGSQGAEQLNALVPQALAQLGHDAALHVIHQCGARHEETTRARYQGARLPANVQVEVAPFIDDVASAMAASHLVISRAGAITLAELCAAARPSLLVPLGLAGGHQRANADALTAAGAAKTLGDLPPGEHIGAAVLVADTLLGLLEPHTLTTMSAAAGALAHPAAAERIADRVAELVAMNPRRAA